MSTEVIGRSAIAGVIIEAVISSHDIYRFYQMMQDGRIDKDQFVDLLFRRIVIALISVVGGELGCVAGFYVAGPAGYFIGGILVNLFGRLIGRAVSGRAVEFGQEVVAYLKSWKKQASLGDSNGFLAAIEPCGSSHIKDD